MKKVPVFVVLIGCVFSWLIASMNPVTKIILPLFKKKISKSRIFFLKPIDKAELLLYNELVFLMGVFIVKQ